MYQTRVLDTCPGRHVLDTSPRHVPRTRVAYDLGLPSQAYFYPRNSGAAPSPFTGKLPHAIRSHDFGGGGREAGREGAKTEGSATKHEHCVSEYYARDAYLLLGKSLGARSHMAVCPAG